MTITESEPVVIPGPTIDGEETSFMLLEPHQLKEYAYSKELLHMVNYTFKISWQNYWPLDGPERFNNFEDFLDRLEPNYFTFILSSKTVDGNGIPKIYATASARTMINHTSTTNSLYSQFNSPVRHIPGKVEAWELKALAVDSKLYRKGIGSILQDLVETEIKRRFEIRTLGGIASGNHLDDELDMTAVSKDIVFALTTIAEVNEQYYSKKGYKTMTSKFLKTGTLGSLADFHVIDMEKIVSV